MSLTPHHAKYYAHDLTRRASAGFGIHADYMAKFRDFLEEEGLPTNDDRLEFLLPVITNLGT